MPNPETKWFFDHLYNKEPFSFSRFNDGEIGGIMYDNFIAARGDQLVNPELSSALKTSLTHQQKNYYVGIPCSTCFPKMYHYANELVGDYKHKIKAVILTNRNWKNFTDNISNAVKNYNILWIGGNDQITDNLPFKINEKILIPRKNSWEYYPQLKEYYKEIPKGWLVFISLGPTARVLTQEWFFYRPDLTVIDIGSNFDPFTRQIKHKCHLGWENGFNIQTPCTECN